MSAKDRFDQAEVRARQQAEAADEDRRRAEAEQRVQARRGPTRSPIAREFARRARDAGIPNGVFTHRYDDPVEVARVQAWLIPTELRAPHRLYVTTAGGVFIGTEEDLVTAPWRHDASALSEDQLESLMAEFLVLHQRERERALEPLPPLNPRSTEALGYAVVVGALGGLAVSAIPALVIGGSTAGTLMIVLTIIGAVVAAILSLLHDDSSNDV